MLEAASFGTLFFETAIEYRVVVKRALPACLEQTLTFFVCHIKIL